jgi:hypothetical protein
MGVLKRACKLGGYCDWNTIEQKVRVMKEDVHIKVVQCRKCGERP